MANEDGNFQLPGDFGLPATSQLYVSGMKIEDAISSQKKTSAPKIANDQRFWASPPLPLNHKSLDGIVINLAKPKKINYLSLDLPHFPQHFYFYWWNDKTNDWEEFKGPSTGVVRVYLDGSTPSVIGPAAAYQSKQHPSHYGAGHWLHYDIDVHPVTTRRIRLQGTRNFGSRKGGPKTPTGKPANYSLGVRNLDFGWRVRKKEDVPKTPRDPDILTENSSFTQTLDLLGNPVELKMRENRATDLLRGSPWKSEAMPVPYAVVNFYVDSRDASGDAQVIDRFDITPLQSGATLNLYYADQMPDADFGASDAPIVFPFLRPAGEVEPQVQKTGILFPDEISYIDLVNQGVQWDPAKPFWIALEFQPQWASTDPTAHIVFDTGALQLAWNEGVFRLAYGGGALYQQPVSFDVNSRMRAVVSYDGERLSFYMPETGVVANVSGSLDRMTSAAIRLGAELGDSTAPAIFTGNFRLNAMVVKQEPLTFVAEDEGGLIIPDTLRQFLDDPEVYLDKAEYQVDEDGSTDNALLRYLPKFAIGTRPESANRHGFVGGPGTIFEDIVWTPIMRDYKLRAGMLQFHPVRAKFFKLEFTNLTPEPYQTFTPVTRRVKTFSQNAAKPPVNPQKTTEIVQSATSPGLEANADATMQTVRYADTPAITNPSSADVLPTEALHATDLGVQNQLDQQGGLYRFDSWQAGSAAPRYVETSKHYYEEVEVTHAKRIAYFVGLSGLKMYRVNYSAPDDGEQYIDLFDDTVNIDPEFLDEKIIAGTTNFVTNPSFEDGTTGYSLYTSGTAADAALATVPGGRFGDNALKVSASTLGSLSTDRVGWQSTFADPDFTVQVAYSVHARRVSGNATLRLNVEYYDAGAAFLSSDSRSFTPEPQRSSALNPNSAFEAGPDGWTGIGGTFTVTTSQFHTGTSSGRITPDGETEIVRMDSAFVPVTQGTDYRAQGWVRCATSRSVSMNINWYDAEGNYLDTHWSSQVVTANTWTFLTTDGTPPAGAAQASVIPTLDATPSVSDVLWADEVELRATIDPWDRCSAVLLPPANTASAKVSWWLEAGDGAVEYHFDGYQVEALHLTDYCDGEQEGCSWTGTANASTSVRHDVNILPWFWDGDRLVTSSNVETSVTTMSRRFPSKRRVRGVQFATQQSGSVQLAPDPDFMLPDLAENWLPVGDVISMATSDDFSTTLGTAVKILRSSGLNTWQELSSAYLTWSALESGEVGGEQPTWSVLEGDSSVVGGGGIEQRTAVQVSQSGRVHAAARVYADHSLSGPLTLQILSSTGDVLAEKDQIVTAGKIVEWSVGYTVGETPATRQTWNDIMQIDPSPTLPTYADLETNLWADLTDIEVAESRNLKVRVMQRSAGEDTWYVDNLSLFEEPILWEFSNDDGATWWPALDIRNNPNGVLVFPNSEDPVPGDATGLRWRVTGFRQGLHISALDIRPWYAETVFGIPRREPGVSGGPNIQPTDHYPPIADDPFFKQWSDPIPQDWYYNFRQLLLLDRQQEPVAPVFKPDTFANPYALLVKVERITPPEPFLDLYTETYPAIYGVANDANQGVYADTYDPENDY